MLGIFKLALSAGTIVGIIIFIIMGAIVIFEIKKPSSSAKSESESLQNKITTEYFEIDISYNVCRSGRVSATFKVVKSPEGVRRVIYDGGSFSLETSYHEHFIVEADTIEELRKDVAWTTSWTMEKIQKVEKNLEAVETNKLMLEVDS